jgi:hypothetical protein
MLGDYLADGYYAVEDPDGPNEPGGDAMTLWRVQYGDIEAYPRRTPYGPIPPDRKDRPADPEERYEWMVQWTELRWSWKARVADALRADPSAAQLRFSERTGRCCICARVLTGASRMLGVGPSCRDALPDGLLAAFLQMRSETRNAR